VSATGESRFGCLGCTWVLALILGTLIPAALLFWLSPRWMDRLMVWKGPVHADRIVLVPAGDGDFEGLPKTRPKPTESPTLWHEKAVRAQYTLQNGATLTTVEGGVFSFPPGSIDRDVPVEVIPVIDLPDKAFPDNFVPVGGLHDLRIDGQDHWQFNRPVSISLPYLPKVVESIPGGAIPVVVAWTGNQWDQLPTRVDTERGLLTAETEHASLVGGIAITVTAFGGTVLKFTQTGQGLWLCITKNLEHTYKTKNFAIHYDTTGGHAVLSDAAYPLTNSRPPGSEPLYVVDIGKHLEDTRAALPKVGMTVKEAGWGTRWDVFLLNLASFGNAEIGGPILLDNKLKIPNRKGGAAAEVFPPSKAYRYLMRKTCAHELMHVAQDAYYNFTNSGAAKPWTEMSAEYQAVHLLELMGEPDLMPHYYIQDDSGFLQVPMHKAHDSSGTQEYAYAEFLQWLEKRGLKTDSFIKSVNSTADPTLKKINQSLAAAGSKDSLSALFRLFAEDLHHSSMWTQNVVPAEVSNVWWRQAGTVFGVLSRQRADKAVATVNTYREERVQLRTLTTTVFHLRAGALPPARQGKLVIAVDAPQELKGHRLGVAQYYNLVDPPLSGRPPPVTWISLLGGRFSTVLDRRIAAPGIEPTDSNRTTLFMVNESLETDGPSLLLTRWLLLAPEFVQYSRFQGGRYQIIWHKAELKSAKAIHGKPVFAGYNVYRKRVSDAEFPTNPINPEPLSGESLFDDPPADERWDYTVTVIDIDGNESEPAAFKLEGDPFEGIWKGKTSLVRGTISEPIIKLVKSEIEKAAVPGENLSQVNSLLNKAGLILKNIDLLLRFGVPMTYEIEHTKDGLYSVTAKTVFGRPVEDPESLQMTRIGAYALAVTVEGKTFNKGLIQLYRENEIKQTFEGAYNDPDLGSGEIGVRLVFEREVTDPLAVN
jgi:hypothetical protein